LLSNIKIKDMKVTDLRIGNYIYYNNEIIKITGIKGNKIYWGNDYYDSIMLNHNLFTPIPLTEEILFKCVGFEKIGIMIESGLFYKIYKQDDAWIIALSNGILIRKLKYLHEFQNIYKELTGEELKINS